MSTDQRQKSAGSYTGYLLYCLILFIPVAHIRFGYHTLFAIEFRRFTIATALLLGGGLFLTFQKTYWKRKHSLHRPMLVLLGALLLAGSFSNFRPIAAETAIHFLVGAMLYYLAAFYIDAERDLERLRGAIAFSTALVAAYSLVQHLGYNPLGLVAEGERQQSATFATRNLLAAYLVFGLLVQIDGLLREKRPVVLVLTGVALLLSLAALGLSLTVSAWLACGVGLAGYLWFARGVEMLQLARLKWALAILLIGLLLVVGIELRKPTGLRRTWQQKIQRLASGESKSVRERIVMWKIALRILLDRDQDRHLLLGGGPGSYRILRDKHAGRYLGQQRYRDLRGLSVWAHNDLLQIASEAGLAGFLPLLLLLAAAIWLPVQLRRKNDASRAHLARTLPFWAGWLALTVHALFHFTLYAPASAFYWWMALGLVAGFDLRVVKKPCATQGIRRVALKGTLLTASLLLPAFVGSQFIARYSQAKGFEKRLAANAEKAENNTTRSAQLQQAARQDYLRSGRLRPWAGKMWAQLGNLELETGQLKPALAAYHQALNWRPYDAQIHYQIGLVTMLQGKLRSALHYGERAIALRPNLTRAYCLLGMIEMRQRNLDQAWAHFQQAIEIDPSDPSGYHFGSVCLQQMDRGGESIQLLERGMVSIRRSEGNMLLTIHLFAFQALRQDMPHLALSLWRAASRHFSGVPQIDTFAQLASQMLGRRRERMRSETIHELDRQVGRLLAGLSTLPAEVKEKLADRRQQLQKQLLGCLRTQLEDQIGEANGLAALGTLGQLRAIIADSQKSIATQNSKSDGGAQLSLMTAARYALELLPEIYTSLQAGPLFPKQDAPREQIIGRLHRLSGMNRTQHTRLQLHGPLYLAELALYHKLLAPSEDLQRPREQVMDDLCLLQAQAHLLAKEYIQASRVLDIAIQKYGDSTVTLLPPWAKDPYTEANTAERAYFEQNRPLTRDIGRLKLAEMALAQGRPGEAVKRARALFEHIRKQERLSATAVPPELAGSMLAQRTLNFAPDRLALTLITFALLLTGEVDAARVNEQLIAQTYPNLASTIANRLKQMKTEKDRKVLLRSFSRLFEDF